MHRMIHAIKPLFTPLMGNTHAALLPRSTFWFGVLFIYFLCSQLLTSATAVYNIGFYALVLPSFLYAVIRQPSLIRAVPCTIGAIGVAGFLLFVALHALIGQFADQSIGKILLGVVFTGIFMLMSTSFFAERHFDSLAPLRCFMLVVIIMAPISYGLYWLNPITEYFLPIGRARNPIPIGNLYAIAAVIATWLFFQPGTSKRWKMLALYCIATVVITIIATTQRGPLLALIVASGAGLVCMHQWKWVALGGVSALIFGGDYAYYTFYGHSLMQLDALDAAIHHFLTSRDSYRPEIWQHAFASIAERPWLGYGMQANFSLAGVPGAVNPHNVFISTLYYTGFVGLLLLLLPLIAAFYYSLRARHEPYHQLCLMLLVHAVVATSTNYGQVAKEAAPLWTIYWLPLAMVFARALPPTLGQQKRPRIPPRP